MFHLFSVGETCFHPPGEIRVAVLTNDQGWFRHGGLRQRINGIVFSVLFLKGFELPKVKGSLRAGGDTDGRLVLVDPVVAEMAFGHDSFFGVVLRGAVGTGPFTVAASRALVRIDEDDTVFSFIYRSGRACFQAERFLAVIAGDGKIECRRFGYPYTIPLFPTAARYFVDAAPEEAGVEIVLVLAGHLTGFAAGTNRSIEEKSVLLGHVQNRLLRSFSTWTMMVCCAFPKA